MENEINLNFSNNTNQLIVDGIANGYKKYLKMRKRENSNLTVSMGLSWAKGNYIDTALENTLQKEIAGVNTSIATAGASGWKYLEFSIPNEEFGKPDLVIVRNSKTIKPFFNGIEKDTPQYLLEIASINNHIFDKSIEVEKLNKAIQLDLFAWSPKVLKLESPQYNRFYIVTYELDKDTQAIKNIMLELPRQKEADFLEIQDLTKYLDNSISITDEELSYVANDDVPDSQYSGNKFNISTIKQEQSEAKK